jgi:hypothetical protein
MQILAMKNRSTERERNTSSFSRDVDVREMGQWLAYVLGQGWQFDDLLLAQSTMPLDF